MNFTITMGASGAGAPTGSITIKDSSAILGSCVLAGNQCTFSVATLVTGRHTITAEYSGDAHFKAARSPAITQTVLARVYLPLIVRTGE